MFIFIPLAHRLGLYGVKSEMENIWLKYKEPEAYAEICRNIDLEAAKLCEQALRLAEDPLPGTVVFKSTFRPARYDLA